MRTRYFEKLPNAINVILFHFWVIRQYSLGKQKDTKPDCSHRACEVFLQVPFSVVTQCAEAEHCGSETSTGVTQSTTRLCATQTFENKLFKYFNTFLPCK